MFEILSVEKDQTNYIRMQVKVPYTQMVDCGQFALITVGEGDSGIPLSVADVDEKNSSVYFIFEDDGEKLSQKIAGDSLYSVLLPLGKPFSTKEDSVLIMCDDKGMPSGGFMAKRLKQQGKRVGLICLSHSPFEDLYKEYADEFYSEEDVKKRFLSVFTNYGVGVISGRYGFLKSMAQLAISVNFSAYVMTNSVIVDGMGLCGGCRLTVGGKVKFACVDGPCFLADEIDFDKAEMTDAYKKREEHCNLLEGGGKWKK